MQASFTKKKPSTAPRLAEFQEQGVPNLVTILEQKGNEFILLNSQNKELSLPTNRVFQIPGRIPPQFAHRNQIVLYLRELSKEANKIKDSINLEKAWETFRKSNKEVNIEQIQKIIFPNQNLANYIAVRWALLNDRHYFRRGKIGFSARAAESIDAIKEAIAKEAEKKAFIDSWTQSILDKNPSPEAIKALEIVAALGNKAENTTEVDILLENLSLKGETFQSRRNDDQAFELLQKLGHFTKHENLVPIKIGRKTAFSEEELNAAKILSVTEEQKDILDLNIFTIDGEDTRDFDDAISLESNAEGFRVGIHITNVSDYIKPGEILWETSIKRASTIYTSDTNYPMLPHIVSEEFLSLVQGQSRSALTVFVQFNKDAELIDFDISKNKIQVSERISYEVLDREFEEGKARQELNSLLALSQKLENKRIAKGAKVLPKREMLPTINEQGDVSLSVLNEETPARKLISEMMILANHCMASYAIKHNIPFLYRHQEKPDTIIDENSIIEGPAREYALRGIMKRSVLSCTPGEHHGLALDCYCQATSPIRRAVDLVNQFQINQFLEKNPSLSVEELEKIIPNLESSLGEVTYIQRKRHRYWLLTFIEQQKLTTFEATVVKCDGPKPLAEIDNLFFISQFNPIKNSTVKLGDRVKLKLEQISARLDRLKLIEYGS